MIFTRADKVHLEQEVVIDQAIYKRDPSYYSHSLIRFLLCVDNQRTQLVSRDALLCEHASTVKWARATICMKN